MLLFQKRFHEGLMQGTVTITFRRWDKPHVKAGGRYRCHPIGVLEVDDVTRVKAKDVKDADVRKSGFDSREELLGMLAQHGDGAIGPDTELYRVVLHYGGDGDRVEGALDTRLTQEDSDEIAAKLERMDAKGPWTARTLALIREHPRVAASQLAKKVGRETAPFKADVVKLKKLGLTQSFEVGYELSPRGKAFLAQNRGRSARARG